jgi:hypothetical protein
MRQACGLPTDLFLQKEMEENEGKMGGLSRESSGEVHPLRFVSFGKKRFQWARGPGGFQARGFFGKPPV